MDFFFLLLALRFLRFVVFEESSPSLDVPFLSDFFEAESTSAAADVKRAESPDQVILHPVM